MRQMHKRIFVVLIILPILSGCMLGTESPLPIKTSQPVGESMQTIPPLSSTQTSTAIPPSPTATEITSTAIPPTTEVTNTSVPTASTTPLIATGTPIPGFEEISIMPGAFDSEFVNDVTYAFFINATVEETETYYLETLGSKGWSIFDRNIMEVSMFTGPATILEFQKNGQSFFIVLFHLAEEKLTCVLLSFSNPTDI